MTTVDSASVRAALETIFPHPADEYTDAFYCQCMVRALTDLAGVYKSRFSETVDEIVSSGLTSPEYVLRFEEKRVREVDVPLLNERMPDLFSADNVFHESDDHAGSAFAELFFILVKDSGFCFGNVDFVVRHLMKCLHADGF